MAKNRSGRKKGNQAAQQPKSEGSSVQQNGGESKKKEALQGPVHLKSLKSLERLREKVETAARELGRLREENAALAERLRALEARTPTVPDGAVVLTLDEEPEAVRRKVEGFIEALDKYLETEEG